MKRLLTGPKRPTPGKRRGKLPPWHKARDQGAIRVGPNGRTRRGRRVTVTSGGRLVEVTDVGTALRVSARVKQAAAKMAALSAKFKKKHRCVCTHTKRGPPPPNTSLTHTPSPL